MIRPAMRSASPATWEGAARLRVTGRLTVAFFLDATAIVRDGGHLLDTLLASAIIQANVAELNRHADQQLAYAEEMPGDELRRPVSMNAVASSLGLPFETVRRRVTGMVRSGYCQFVDGGVIVPSAVLSRPEYAVNGFRTYERLRAFYCDLRDHGLLQDLPPPTVELAPGAFPMRAVARLLGAYLLRVIEAISQVADLTDGLLLLEIFRSNVEALPLESNGDEGEDALGIVADQHRTPIAMGALARRVGLPDETVRRRVNALLALGAIERLRGGLIVPARNLAHPPLRVGLETNARNLQRLFVALAGLGVLQIWDGLPRPQV